MVGAQPGAADHVAEGGASHGVAGVAEGEDIAGGDGHGVVAVDELAEAALPQVVDEDQAGLEVPARHDREDRLVRVDLDSLGADHVGEVGKPDQVQSVGGEALRGHLALGDEFEVVPLIDDVADQEPVAQLVQHRQRVGVELDGAVVDRRLQEGDRALAARRRHRRLTSSARACRPRRARRGRPPRPSRSCGRPAARHRSRPPPGGRPSPPSRRRAPCARRPPR